MVNKIGLFFAIFIGACNTVPKETSQVKKLPYYQTADFTPYWLEGKTLPDTFHQIPAFSFTNQYGEIVTEKTVQGKIYIADFFFTTCPGICKQMTTHLTKVQKCFETDSTVLILSHTVTPETDSLPKLKRYASDYGAIKNKWHLLTGKKDEIYTIARQSYFADEDLGLKRGTNDFLHTENFLLIDKHSRIRGVYRGTYEPDITDLIADIKLLLAEK
jgi:protein SCO1/2